LPSAFCDAKPQPLGGSEKISRAQTRKQACSLHEQGGLLKKSAERFRVDRKMPEQSDGVAMPWT
jgi:hypothetical protein